MSLYVAPGGARRTSSGGFSVEAASSWLDSFPNDPSPADMGSLIGFLESLNSYRFRVGARLDLSERAHSRAMRCRASLESMLNDESVPMSAQARNHAAMLDATLAALAGSYRILLAELSRRLFGLASSGRALLPAFRSMQLLHQRMILAYRHYGTVPKGVWQDMHGLHQFALKRGLSNRTATDLPETPSTIYRKALLTAFAEPQRLVRHDLERLLEFVEQNVHKTAVAVVRGRELVAGNYLVKPHRDMAGVFFGQHRQPDPQQGDMVFSCAALVDELDQLQQVSPQYASLIDALRKRWIAKPARRLNRLQTHARVEIFVGLDPIWSFLSGDRDERSAGHWVVTNESRYGFALVHSGRPVEQIGVGDVVGLHAGNGRSCHLCLVRWIQSDNPEHIEVGLEEIGSSVRSVALTVGDDAAPVRALLLHEGTTDARGAAIVSSPVPLQDRWKLTVGALDSRLVVRPRAVRESTNLIQITDLDSEG